MNQNQNPNMNQNMQMNAPRGISNNMPQGTPNNAQQFINNNPSAQQPVKKKRKGLSKELVTIIGVVLIMGILYFTYNYQLNKSLEISKNIPIAARQISAGTKITEEDIETIDVPSSMLSNFDIVTDMDEIIGQYVLYDALVPEGSFFYNATLSADDISPDAMFKDLTENEDAIMMDVSLETTYGNSIMPGNVIDIYAEAVDIGANKDGENEYIVGPLVTGAKVLAVLDSNGQNVFADHNEVLSPRWFVFTLSSDIIQTIRKAQKLQASAYQIELFPVVSGKSWNTAGDNTLVSQNYITNLIENATIEIKSEE